MSNCHSATSIAASNTPMPPGAWLAKPSSVAETKITVRVMKPMWGSDGISTYMAAAQQARSTMPIAICSKVSGPPGSVTCQLLCPIWRGLPPHPGHIDREHGQDRDRQDAIDPRRQLVDRARGLRHDGDAKAQHGGVAEPEREAGDEADLGDVDRVEPHSE